MMITAYLYYEDVAAAQRFLARAFGLKRGGAAKRAADGRLLHAAMKLGDGLVMMGFPGPKYKNPRRLGQATQSLYVNVADVDKHFERARKAGATILQAPGNTPYSQRRYGAEDPEGHQWYFAEETKRRASKQRRR